MILISFIEIYFLFRYPHLNGTLCTERRCSCAILLSFFLPPILCAPTYLVFNINEVKVYENSTQHVLYHVHTISDLDRTPYIANFWFHGVVIKLLPCIVLTVISCWLIRALYSANRNKRRLMSGYNSVRWDKEIISNILGNVEMIFQFNLSSYRYYYNIRTMARDIYYTHYICFTFWTFTVFIPFSSKYLWILIIFIRGALRKH